jgi:membrane peptidoglycan carboxypeptidase
VYAQLTKVVGPKSVVRTAKELGITSPLQSYFAIGLGAEPVNPLEMARAYGTFANGGFRIDGAEFGDTPRAVTRIDDVNGKPLYVNAPQKKRVLSPAEDALITQMLQGVITSGTGVAAALPNRPVAGKTGTTENYGDAWFVGYTPQLVTAVWVGYPNGLRPMLSEYQGRSVTGGTFPAQIWKTFMQSALAEVGAEPQSFPSPPYLSSAARRVTYRDGQVQLDNGRCRDTSLVVYFSGKGPAQTANCRLNEVEVPNVVGSTLATARIRLEAQPLTPQPIYKPATAGQRVDVVLGQFPKKGRLSSFDKVTIVLAKPQHGVVPQTVGLKVRQARAQLRKLKLTPSVRFGSGKAGRVVSQVPVAGVAAAPGMTVRLVVGRRR